MEAFRAVAVRAARKAGRILQSRLGRVKKVEYKGAVNLVTEMDLLSEKMIVSAIRAAFPRHSILSEEQTDRTEPSPYRWVVDPLDGTTNYAHGFPVYCVSIGLAKEEEIILGVVYDPSRDELFVAEKGKGARLNGRRIRVSSAPLLSQSLLATGFPYDLRKSPVNNFDHFQNFARRVHAVRRAGSAALDLCYVAAARFDGFWEMKLGAWDLAAGSLMVKEAGGTVSDFSGKPIFLDGSHVLATNGKIHREMIGVLKRGRL
ncbi:MAG TPA: inositol monophosphatase family protein [Thermodesulfobacteriota bacterium]|nr:inositol monophosphatase family protein [Thermodesulfobacteriota bacterium]